MRMVAVILAKEIPSPAPDISIINCNYQRTSSKTCGEMYASNLERVE
jgi:hypothetical protein